VLLVGGGIRRRLRTRCGVCASSQPLQFGENKSGQALCSRALAPRCRVTLPLAGRVVERVSAKPGGGGGGALILQAPPPRLATSSLRRQYSHFGPARGRVTRMRFCSRAFAPRWKIVRPSQKIGRPGRVRRAGLAFIATPACAGACARNAPRLATVIPGQGPRSCTKAHWLASGWISRGLAPSPVSGACAELPKSSGPFGLHPEGRTRTDRRHDASELSERSETLPVMAGPLCGRFRGVG
jgi:hypothetical protein